MSAVFWNLPRMRPATPSRSWSGSGQPSAPLSRWQAASFGAPPSSPDRKVVERLVGRLCNLSRLYPEVGAELHGGYTIANAKRRCNNKTQRTGDRPYIPRPSLFKRSKGGRGCYASPRLPPLRWKTTSGWRSPPQPAFPPPDPPESSQSQATRAATSRAATRAPGDSPSTQRTRGQSTSIQSLSQLT